MSDAFDPYHRWLGIPPEEQPPHYYRLLGIALFESNPDVIESAADRQMTHLRTYQSGRQSEWSQRLLNEVAAAKVCLLNPQRRAVYDEQLRQYFAAYRPVAVPPPAAPPAAPLPPEAQLVPVALSVGPSEASQRLARQRRQAQRGMLVGAAVVGLILIGAAVLWRAGMLDKLTESPVHIGEPDRHIVDGPGDKPPAGEKTPGTETPGGEQPKPEAPNGGKTPPDTAPKPPDPTPKPPDPTPKPPDPTPKPPDPTPKPPDPTPKPPTPPDEGVAKRQPVPTPEQKAPVLKLATEMFKLGPGRSAADNLRSVGELLAQADKSGENYVERFVLLQEASRLSGEAGDAAQMLKIVDTLGLEFETDPLAIKEKLLTRFADGATDAARLQALVEAGRGLTAQAIAEDRFEQASRIAEMVQQACAKPAAGKAYRKETGDLVQRVQQLQARYKPVAQARDTLKTQPDDPAANQAVGRWMCLVRRQWATGLGHLAKGPDKELAALAARELAESPEKPEDQLKLADAWWDLSQTRSGDDRDLMQVRAGEWYGRARPSATGLTQARIDKRMAEIAKLAMPSVELAQPGGDQPRPGSDTVPLGQWFDLLPRIDAQRDSVRGDWKRSGDALTLAAGDFSRLALPIRLRNAQYDLELELTRSEGADEVAFVLPVGATQCAFVLSASAGQVSGFELVKGRNVTNNRNVAVRRPGTLLNNRRNIVLIGVRLTGQQCLLDVAVNGKPYGRAGGDIGDLSLPPNWALPATDQPGIGANRCAVSYKAVRIRVRGGTATLAPAAKPAGGPVAPPGGGPSPAPFTPRLPDPIPGAGS